MTNETDVLVIGAGVIGCAIARDLARRGARVDVVDARAVGAGATQASAGVLAPYIEAHEGGALLDLTVRSLAMYDGWIEEIRAESGMDVEYGRNGTLEVALDDRAADRLSQMVSRFGGRETLIWRDAAEVRAAEPALSHAARGGLSVPAHGYVSAPALTAALARSAERLGAKFHTGRAIKRLVPDGHHVQAFADDGASWRPGKVVIAAGSWIGQIAGVDSVAANGVKPVRGQLLRLAWRGQPLARVVWGPACYVVPWRDGTVLVGATMEDVGFEERNTVCGIRGLMNAACELLPRMGDATFVDARSGLRPATSDGLPTIGASPASPRVIFAAGHYRNGILLAPLTAALVADLLYEGGAEPALGVVSPARA